MTWDIQLKQPPADLLASYVMSLKIFIDCANAALLIVQKSSCKICLIKMF